MRLPQIHLQIDNAFHAVLIVAGIIGFILLVSFLSFYIARYYILRIVEKLSHARNYTWLKAAYYHRVFHRLSLIVPACILYGAAPLLGGISFSFIAALANPLKLLTAAYMVFMGALVISGLLNSINDQYNHFEFARQRPIKSYLEVIKIIVFSITALIIISIFMDKSPAYFLTSIGAMTAILVLVFRDSILGFVASIQLAAYDMIRLGDWIEVPSFGADGNVIEISLNTIKVQNFDNAIIMLPSYALLSSGVKNWRGMQEAGCRRMKRAIYIDPHTIKFCDEELLDALKKNVLFQLWLDQQTIDSHQTNLGLLRLYIENYLQHHPALHKEMTLLVRELETEGKGIPLEIYAFTCDTRMESYEYTQAGVFEHMYAVLPFFGLKVFCKG